MQILPNPGWKFVTGVCRWAAGILLLTGCHSMPALSPSDQTEIQAVMDAQAGCWNVGDLEGFLKDYEDSEDMTFISGDRLIEGKAALQARYETSYPADQRGVLRFGDLRLTALGANTRLVLGTWHLTRPPDDPHGRFSLVFRRGGDGWKILHDHSSSAEPEPEPKDQS